MKLTTKKLCLIAIIASVYIALSLLLAPISFGVVQFRPQEALTILPLLFPESVIGLFIGCAVSNIFSPLVFIDMAVGGIATLIAGLITMKCKNVFIGGIPPVIINAFLIPLIYYFFAGNDGYFLMVLSIFISQFISVYVLGVPLFYGIKRLKNNLSF